MCVCIIALVIPQANCFFLWRNILSSVVCLAVTIFLTLNKKWHDLKMILLDVNVCFDFLYKCVWNITHSKKNLVV